MKNQDITGITPRGVAYTLRSVRRELNILDAEEMDFYYEGWYNRGIGEIENAARGRVYQAAKGDSFS